MKTALEKAGFILDENVLYKDMRIDILAEKDLPDVPKDYKVACFFRHAESDESVRELILKLRDKQIADKILLVIDGIEVLGEDRLIASEFNLIICHKENVEDFVKKPGKLLALLDLGTYFNPDLKYTGQKTFLTEEKAKAHADSLKLKKYSIEPAKKNKRFKVVAE